MRDLLRNNLLLMLSFVLLLGLPACTEEGEEDDTPTIPGEETETIAPLVIEFDPDDGDFEVAVDEEILIRFSEAMDPTTSEGNITISSGTITEMEWESQAVLLVSHSNWEEGIEITVTVGTGLTDEAGNALPQAFNSSFYTISSVPVLLFSEPEDGATDVLRNIAPVLYFSHEMDLASLESALSISQPDPGKAEFVFELNLINAGAYRITFTDLLVENQEYGIQVSTDALSVDSVALSAAVDFSFTTGVEIDEIPPTLTSMSPATGSEVNDTQDTIDLFFSEPIDPESLEPNELSAHFMIYMLSDPVWTAPDRLTLYLRTPLPAGINFKAVFGAGSFRDLVGNVNTAPFTAELTVAGTPDYYPINPNFEYYYFEEGEDYNPQYDPADHEYVQDLKAFFDNIDGELCERLEYQSWEEGVWEPSDHWLLRKTNSGIAFRGFEENDGFVMFSPEVDYLPLPVPATWSGISELSIGGDTMDMTFSGERIETGLDLGPFGDDPPLIYEDCIVVDLTHTMTVPASGDTVMIGVETLVLCPGIGMVRMDSVETKATDEGEAWSNREMTLQYIEWKESR
ncbi:MAG: Ig-like domain-containing protein [Gemmatimonadales bacterium]|nr:Ig-like domain-containing protein [Gemmatimonadales bacterium]